MSYELWDTDSNNLIAASDSLANALSFAWSGAVRNGRASLDHWVLMAEDQEGAIETLAEGQAILDLPSPAQASIAR